ncbi:Intracellular proteinase inhibitor [Ferrimonas sediminum]|uniref:Intracellular proteinase inhibitor n=1 Tax=Ferrimonas sediminum TaxID=718193 RepID=A0A1G8WYF6_9GAMM|nr:BsuPI-related putative proteinase inhibitor [Ferrimonas sediminum]SDJ83409.1 Intracellular proteinase inhibitor [Ferrimonas sediminum]
MKHLWILTLAMALSGCGSEVATEAASVTPPKAPLQAAETPTLVQETAMSVLTMALEVPNTQWSRDQALPVTLTISNDTEGDTEVTILSGMTADLVMTGAEGVVWQFSHEMMFTQALREWYIGAGTVKTLSFTISSERLSALAPGKYTLQAVLNTREHPETAPLVIQLK